MFFTNKTYVGGLYLLYLPWIFHEGFRVLKYEPSHYDRRNDKGIDFSPLYFLTKLIRIYLINVIIFLGNQHGLSDLSFQKIQILNWNSKLNEWKTCVFMFKVPNKLSKNNTVEIVLLLIPKNFISSHEKNSHVLPVIHFK